jgi:hypothetical protein
MDIPFINDYPWEALEQAYGSAEQAPIWLKSLTNKDEERRDEAIYEFLHSQACHQYSTYSCTPPVVKCVIYILENYNFQQASQLSNVLGFINACTYNAKASRCPLC